MEPRPALSLIGSPDIRSFRCIINSIFYHFCISGVPVLANVGVLLLKRPVLILYIFVAWRTNRRVPGIE
jgi:hypothetical protein